MEPKTQLEEIWAKWSDDDATGLYEPAQDTITLSSLNNTLSNVTIGSPYTVTGAIGAHFPNTIYTTGTATSAPWATFNPNSTSARINLTGDEADIEVNGWSLVDAVKRIEERLDLFQPNPELEKEWAELHELGKKYRELEQYIKDKQATWDRLKAMPAPDID
jgi:hypothetical protein